MTWAFYFCVAISVGLAVWSHTVHQRQTELDEQRRKEAEEKLITQSNLLLQQSEELQRLVQSLPPTNFLSRYGEQLRVAHEAHLEAYRGVDLGSPQAAPAIALLTRSILRSIGKIFAVYDNAEGAAIGVNVMLYVPIAQLEDAGCDFLSRNQSLSELEGALVGDARLSARADKPTSEHGDPDLPLLRLPVPVIREVSGGGRTYRCVLPGAPLAWTERITVAYPSQESLLADARDECAFPADVLEGLREYFRGRGRNVQSFVSIPLAAEEAAIPVAILNVHSSQPGLLENRPVDAKFQALLKPLLAQVVDMLGLLAEADASVPDALEGQPHRLLLDAGDGTTVDESPSSGQIQEAHNLEA